jgi:hypothetical protein
LTNDFLQVLVDRINSIPNLPTQASSGFTDVGHDLTVYSLPGGSVDSQDMLGARDVSLPHEILYRTKSQGDGSAVIWAITNELSEFDLTLPSENGSYEFLSLEVGRPTLQEQDDQEYLIYTLDVIAKLHEEPKEI